MTTKDLKMSACGSRVTSARLSASSRSSPGLDVSAWMGREVARKVADAVPHQENNPRPPGLLSRRSIRDTYVGLRLGLQHCSIRAQEFHWLVQTQPRCDLKHLDALPQAQDTHLRHRIQHVGIFPGSARRGRYRRSLSFPQSSGTAP